MLLLGCRPKERNTEQHDVLFAIGDSNKDIVPVINNFWPEAKNKIHVDAWRKVTCVNGFSITILPKKDTIAKSNNHRLFFINLGGYKPNEFDEFHYKMLVVAENKARAIQQAKTSAFFKHVTFKDAPSHIDDSYGIDVDDCYEIQDILPQYLKEAYQIHIENAPLNCKEDEMYLGYFKLDRFLLL
jgi:Domain of Unknown Function (DUF1543)